jgi:tRNA modification GTPase
VFQTDDTIVAIATPPGHAGIGVVRVAGPRALDIAGALLTRPTLTPRRATVTRLRAPSRDGRAIDQVVATWFPAPNSYTGDHVVELSAHGSPVLLDSIVQAAIAAGARLAEPGEFTLRAYVNGKIDLVQAEAVADLVDAVTPSQARVAYDQLDGTLSRALAEIAGALFDLRVRLEASLDFPDEGYHFMDPDAAERELAAIDQRVSALLAGSRRGRLIREGRRVVILGPANAGKSSLFNRLLQTDRAIVTEEAGTTRDLLTERVDIGGVPVTLVDTAGIRDASGLVEREGISRAMAAGSSAAVRLIVLDATGPFEPQWEPVQNSGQPRVVVANKSDRPSVWEALRSPQDDPMIRASMLTGEGLDDIRGALIGALGAGELLGDMPSVANVRQIALLETVAASVREARDAVAARQHEELVLAGLQDAQRALDEIVGRRTAEDVLQAIFSRFCIGK